MLDGKLRNSPNRLIIDNLIQKLLSINGVDRASNISVCSYVQFVMYGALSDEVRAKLMQYRPSPKHIQTELVERLAREFKESGPELAREFKESGPAAEALVGPWFVDVAFSYRGKQYIIEIDGIQHYNAEGKLVSKDVARDKALKEMGYHVFRFSNRVSADSIIKDLITKVKVSEPHFGRVRFFHRATSRSRDAANYTLRAQQLQP